MWCLRTCRIRDKLRTVLVNEKCIYDTHNLGKLSEEGTQSRWRLPGSYTHRWIDALPGQAYKSEARTSPTHTTSSCPLVPNDHSMKNKRYLDTH